MLYSCLFKSWLRLIWAWIGCSILTLMLNGSLQDKQKIGLSSSNGAGLSYSSSLDTWFQLSCSTSFSSLTHQSQNFKTQRQARQQMLMSLRLRVFLQVSLTLFRAPASWQLFSCTKMIPLTQFWTMTSNNLFITFGTSSLPRHASCFLWLSSTTKCSDLLKTGAGTINECHTSISLQRFLFSIYSHSYSSELTSGQLLRLILTTLGSDHISLFSQSLPCL